MYYCVSLDVLPISTLQGSKTSKIRLNSMVSVLWFMSEKQKSDKNLDELRDEGEKLKKAGHKAAEGALALWEAQIDMAIATGNADTLSAIAAAQFTWGDKGCPNTTNQKCGTKQA